jgi:hypothetical protein
VLEGARRRDLDAQLGRIAEPVRVQLGVALRGPHVEQEVVLLVEEAAEELRDVVPVEDELRALELDEPAVVAPGVQELATRARELEVQAPRAPTRLLDETRGLREVLDHVRAEQDVARSALQRQALGVRLEERRRPRDRAAALGVVERELVEDEARAPEGDRPGSDLDHELAGGDPERVQDRLAPRHQAPGRAGPAAASAAT